MATKYSGRWCRDGASESIALFSDKVSVESLQAWVDFIWDHRKNLEWVDVIDMDTGEVVADRYAFDEVDNCDDDCGFDPYLGCYTDDC